MPRRPELHLRLERTPQDRRLETRQRHPQRAAAPEYKPKGTHLRLKHLRENLRTSASRPSAPKSSTRTPRSATMTTRRAGRGAHPEVERYA